MYVKYGTIFTIDYRTVHAGGFSNMEHDMAERVQFCVSTSALDVEHCQLEVGAAYKHNKEQMLLWMIL